MASKTNNLFTFCFLLFVLPACIAKKSFRPKALILPVTKDAATLQHITYITQKNPLKPIKLQVDLGGHTLWVDCENAYNSSTYKHVRCNSAQCKLAKSPFCGHNCVPGQDLPRCTNETCYSISPVNPYVDPSTYSGGVVSEDVILIQSTNGSNLGRVATLPRFIFTCVPSWFAQGLPSGVIGFAGLGRSRIALPTQLAQTFSFPRKFGICLSSSTKSKGVIIFGKSPFVMLPYKIDVSKNLIYTPLFSNVFGDGSDPAQKEPASEYFIGVKSIKINGKTVKLNTTLLSINAEANGGTKITTTTPHTILETSIYKAITEDFIKQLPSNVTRVAPVEPFGVCFSSKSIAYTHFGPAVPPIDLVLQNKKVVWRIIGANSMVQVNEDVLCLGFVDNGPDEGKHRITWPMASITIGAHQIEDNLLQFDLAKSRLGFSNSLLFRQTKCANFDFTSQARSASVMLSL